MKRPKLFNRKAAPVQSAPTTPTPTATWQILISVSPDQPLPQMTLLNGTVDARDLARVLQQVRDSVIEAHVRALIARSQPAPTPTPPTASPSNNDTPKG